MSKPAPVAQGFNAAPAAQSDKTSRYVQLLLLVLAAGAIYPILYLRQVYQTTMLEVFQINHSELGYLYSMLGTIFLLSYLPSGWLADRIAPRFLIFFSLVATGALGLWYSSAPSLTSLMIIFGCWGLTTGLTFWASVLKRVKMIAQHSEQGRFFGILDGGRGPWSKRCWPRWPWGCSPWLRKPVASRRPKGSSTWCTCMPSPASPSVACWC